MAGRVSVQVGGNPHFGYPSQPYAAGGLTGRKTRIFLVDTLATAAIPADIRRISGFCTLAAEKRSFDFPLERSKNFGLVIELAAAGTAPGSSG